MFGEDTDLLSTVNLMEERSRYSHSAIPYTKENAEKLEMQKYSQRGKAYEKE